MAELHSTHVLKGAVFALLGFFIFSSGDALAKFLSATYSVPQLIFWAQIGALVLLAAISTFKMRSAHIGLRDLVRTTTLRLHIIRGMVLGIQVFFTFYAFSQIPLAQAYTLIFCAPLFASLISAVWLKEHVSIKDWITLLIGFSGILLILRPGFSDLDIQALLPLLSALFSGVLFAAGHVAGRLINRGDSPLTFGFYPAFFGLIFGFIYILTSGESFLPATQSDIFLMGVLSLASVGGLLFVSWAFAIGPVPVVASFHYTQLLWGTLFGILFFSDTADIWTWLGAIPIVGSGLYMTWTQKSGYPPKKSRTRKSRKVITPDTRPEP